MRVLVCGSTGLIGSALVERLRADGHEVHRLVRRDPGDGDAYLDGAAGTIDASRLPGASLEMLDAVVNLAGEPLTPSSWREPPRWTAAKRERIRSSRVRTTEILATALAGLAAPPAVLVSASAIGFYGDRGDEQVLEGTRPGYGFVADLCVDWEAATKPAEQAGIRVVHARSGVVLDRNGGYLALVLPVFRRGLGARIGGGWQWMSWISLEDEVAALVHAASDPSLSGPLNVVSPNPARNREITAELAAALHRPALLSLPVGPIRMLLGEDAAGYALASQRVIPRKLQRSGFRFAHPDLAGALAAALADPEHGGAAPLTHEPARAAGPPGGA